MLCEKTEEGGAQTTAGKCSKEETRNGEATVRTQQKDQIFMKTNKPIWRAALTVSMSNKIFCCRFRCETYEL
jgi:hypothetical protein